MSEPCAAVCASLLRQGRTLDRASRLLGLTGLLAGGAQALSGPPHLPFGLLCLGVFLLWLAQLYWALRVAFDAELFDRLAGSDTPLPTLDGALRELGLKPAGQDSRTLPARCQAALRLLRRQGVLLAAQGLLAGAALLAVLTI